MGNEISNAKINYSSRLFGLIPIYVVTIGNSKNTFYLPSDFRKSLIDKMDADRTRKYNVVVSSNDGYEPEKIPGLQEIRCHAARKGIPLFVEFPS